MEDESTHKILQEVSKKLDVLIKLSAIGAVGHQTLREQIRLLDAAGLQPKDIAVILGKSPNHVRVELVYIRKKGAGDEN